MQMILILALALAALARGQSAPTTQAEWDEHLKAIVTDSLQAAQTALTGLDELATEDNFKSLGFTALSEVKTAKLGDPFPVVLVRLDELKKFAKRERRSAAPFALSASSDLSRNG